MTEEILTIKIHSAIDLITNSSTEIYCNSDGSLEPAKEMINTMLETFGINHKADDIFYFGVFADDYYYTDHLEEN